MLVSQQFGFSLGKSLQTVVELAGFATAVLPSHIPGQECTDEEDDCRSCHVYCVARDVAGPQALAMLHRSVMTSRGAYLGAN